MGVKTDKYDRCSPPVTQNFCKKCTKIKPCQAKNVVRMTLFLFSGGRFPSIHCLLYILMSIS